MIKLVCFVHRHPDLSPEVFERHWAERHGPLIAGLPSLRERVVRYEQNHRLPSDRARDEGFDGATIMWFESMADYDAFAMDPLYASEVAPDEARFMDRSRTTFFFTEDAETKIGDEASRAEAGVKLLALLKRRADRSAAEFHAHWSGPHADLFVETPSLRDTILAYDQSHRRPEDYARDPDTPWDGLAEQWYASLDDFARGAAGPAFDEVVVPDEERFMDRAATRFILCSSPKTVFG
jgi:uncharacterized protein (TIGR02118 family)